MPDPTDTQRQREEAVMEAIFDSLGAYNKSMSYDEARPEMNRAARAALAAADAHRPQADDLRERIAEAIAPFIDVYCGECHGTGESRGGHDCMICGGTGYPPQPWKQRRADDAADAVLAVLPPPDGAKLKEAEDALWECVDECRPGWTHGRLIGPLVFAAVGREPDDPGEQVKVTSGDAEQRAEELAEALETELRETPWADDDKHERLVAALAEWRSGQRGTSDD